MLQFDVTHALPFLPENWLSSRLDGLTEARNLLERGNGLGGAFTGWVDLPASYDPEELQRILQTARIIRGQSEVLIVIGIGGSYLGARAMLELLTSPNYNLLRKKTPQIFFTGNTLSSDALTELLDYVRDKDFSVNVISKSGDTTESSIAFFLFRRLLEEKYGREGARDRIFATTDRREGTLRALANQAGYATFSVPASIGGRYSVLTAAGLLPLAVAGLDIQEMLAGSADAMGVLRQPGQDNPAWQYAAARNALYAEGKLIELLACYEPHLRAFGEWWKQLFGESEGKDGQGVFPASVEFTTDLHSMGQYIQEGARNLFETTRAWTFSGERTCGSSTNRPGGAPSWPTWPAACPTSCSPCRSAPPTGRGSWSISLNTPAACPAICWGSIPLTSPVWRPIKPTCSPCWASPASRPGGRTCCPRDRPKGPWAPGPPAKEKHKKENFFGRNL